MLINTKYKRIVFIHLPYRKKGGIPIVDTRNENILSYFTDCLDSYAINRFELLGKTGPVRYFTLLKILLGFKLPLHALTERIGTLKPGTVVFISHSTSGLIAEQVKKLYPDIPVITFFHNIELSYAWQSLKESGRWTDLRTCLIAAYTERLSLKFSDKVLVLNERDKQLLARTYYLPEHTYFFPISLQDRFNPLQKIVRKDNERLKILFVGTYFPSNRDGILWMAKYITPYVDADFYVIGSGMDKMKKKLTPYKNIFLTGQVSQEELDQFYYHSDLFISMLFYGGGMKTKVAEAMMFGLPIIGTKETFQGYEQVHEKAGFNSNQPEKIISFINRINTNRHLLRNYSENARNIYLKEYSYLNSLERMKKIME